MALGYDVIVVGVHMLGYREQVLPAWRRCPSWFDGWALASDPRMRFCDADQLHGVFTPAEVTQLHKEFAKRVLPTGAIEPSTTTKKVISDDDGFWQTMPDIPPSPTIEEMDRLLSDAKLKWVIIRIPIDRRALFGACTVARVR